jgi:hypothetical protein
VQRPITGFHQDEHGDWIAELACGHQRHVRHQPPFESRPWVVDPEGRRRRLGEPIECGLCEQESGVRAAAAGGEPACLAHIVCPDCGAVLDGGAHRPGCSSDD